MKKLLMILVVLFTINSFGQQADLLKASVVIVVNNKTDRVSYFKDYEIVLGEYKYGFSELLPNSDTIFNEKATILSVKEIIESENNQFVTTFKEDRYRVIVNTKTNSSPYNSIIIFKLDKNLEYFETIYYLINLEHIKTVKTN